MNLLLIFNPNIQNLQKFEFIEIIRHFLEINITELVLYMNSKLRYWPPSLYNVYLKVNPKRSMFGNI